MRGSRRSDAATGSGFPCIYMPQIQVSTFVSSLSVVSASSSLFTILQISLTLEMHVSDLDLLA